MSFGNQAVRAFVRSLLEREYNAAVMGETEGNASWTLQGFGMLRCYLPGDWRLNIWNKKFRVENVSLIHDHPWHFESLVVSGLLQNQRFTVEPADQHSDKFLALKPSLSRQVYHCSKLQPGVGGGLLNVNYTSMEPVRSLVKLTPLPTETYTAGRFYMQNRDEVHLSDPADGCITLNRRFDRNDVDVARVFWPWGQQWVSAEPRRANSLEVEVILKAALDGWKQEDDSCF